MWLFAHHASWPVIENPVSQDLCIGMESVGGLQIDTGWAC
jgi:hypothetical protein